MPQSSDESYQRAPQGDERPHREREEHDERGDERERIVEREPRSADDERVQPATDLTSLAQIASFTLASTPTIPPAGWAKVDVDIAVPAGLSAGRHLRVLPRIVNDRCSIDLLT